MVTIHSQIIVFIKKVQKFTVFLRVLSQAIVMIPVIHGYILPGKGEHAKHFFCTQMKSVKDHEQNKDTNEY